MRTKPLWFARSDATEHAWRRNTGLACWGLGTLLSTWAWTLQHSIHGVPLEDLLRKASSDPGVDLTLAREWASWFYGLDTLLYVPLYPLFGFLITRQLQRSLRADFSLANGAPTRRFVSPFLSLFPIVAYVLLAALVVADLGENSSALTQLLAYSHDAAHTPSARAAWIFCWATGIKSALIVAVVAWLGTATLLWLLGAALPIRPELLAVRLSVRNGLIDVLNRTRYCLLTVVAYALLMLGVDQAQDVLTGLAGFLREPLLVALSLLAGTALGVFALHTHSHAVWVWSRLLVRIRGQYEPDPQAREHITTFAKWWGRFLGAAPWFVVLVLCVRTAGSASHLRDTQTTWLMLLAGTLATGWGVGFILFKEWESRSGRRKGTRYCSSDDDEDALLRDRAYSFLGIKPSPLWIPLVALAGIVLVRWLYAHEVLSDACHALAAISFGFALWSSVVNRLALNSLRTRFPWILSLCAIAAILAALGLTQNHMLLAGDGIAHTSTGAASLKHMFRLTFVLAAVIAIAYSVWLGLQSRWTVNRRLLVSWAVLVGGTAVVLGWGASGDAREPTIPSSTLDERQSLQVAVTEWLKSRSASCGAGCSSIPVYLVSAEGGGIRAAYYTARMLSELSAVDALQMKDRIFSLSGVSGGSLGVMAWRLCVEKPGATGCVTALGARDLLTPLASVWMYEDALALVLPTGMCDLPGCGFVDRGSWFERSIERARPEFSQPLPLTAPYVFLNATWVETGERSIASNVQIETRRCVELRQRAVETGRGRREDFDDCHPLFPTARDQLFEIGAVARASTLAHNSARFPYFNPIGYVRGQGHLADGGYFDNSGTQTTVDVLNEFVRQLTCKGEQCPLGEQTQAIADKVSFTAIAIRNGVLDNSDPAEANCAVPRPKRPQGTLSNAAGPPITALNATGIGTPNRVAQCNLHRALLRLQGRLQKQQSEGGYFDVRLVRGQTLYPLGWYLSPAAREGIEKAAATCVGPGHLADALLRTPFAPSADRAMRCFDRVP